MNEMKTTVEGRSETWKGWDRKAPLFFICEVNEDLDLMHSLEWREFHC